MPHGLLRQLDGTLVGNCSSGGNWCACTSNSFFVSCCGFDPCESGSKFTVFGDFEGAMIKGALGKAVEKDGVKQLANTLDQLDALASASA